MGSRDNPGTKRHLTVGWCWRCDLDGDPAVWGIYGHVPDDEARAIVDAYEHEPPTPGIDDRWLGSSITRDWRRTVPCRRHECAGECSGSHLEPANGPGRGASPFTWVEVPYAR